MPRDMEQYEKEYLKIAMLKQEEIFRHQVHELHRLYQIQKLLMRDMKNVEMKRQRHIRTDIDLWNVENETGSNQRQCHNYSEQRQPRRVLNLELPAEEYKGKRSGEVMRDADEESDLELTLATGSSRTQRKKKDTSFTSDSGSSFSSSSNESESIKQNSNGLSLLQVPDISTRIRNDRKSGFDIKEKMRKDGLNQPPWLFQCAKRDMVVSFGL